ncbi:MAG: tyrosine--tRNA ligase [Actinomycetota bacterium]|nr:tyrosine--tRNA ligase [Actinomycetota bacterium]
MATSERDGAVEATLAWLERDVVDSGPEGALLEKLQLAEEEERPLRVKLGMDPTAPDIHLGHAVVLRKLREFQELGHTAVLIVGDFTARVGDPSGRSATRPEVPVEEIERGADTYERQANMILRRDRLELRRNSEWLDTRVEEMLQLASTTTTAQILQRSDFARRLDAREPISLLELIYPLLQGYDSVAIEADVELGATDQTFNVFLARDIQRAYGQPGQAVMTLPILRGTDGVKKMSSSVGNVIRIADPPDAVRKKVGALPDELLPEYFELLLERPPPASATAASKAVLAEDLLTWLSGKAHA